MISNNYNIDGEQFTIHHNGDYSGDVQLVICSASRIEHNDGSPTYGFEAFDIVSIPFELLRKVVLDYLRSAAIREIEEKSYNHLEGLARNTLMEDELFKMRQRFDHE
jgi:hypothetical protein